VVGGTDAEGGGKGRMLDAYRGAPRERFPVAPEFWTYYPAKLLGVDMVEFEREVPFWEALQKTFAAFGCEGWGAAFAEPRIEGARSSTRDEALGEGRFREIKTVEWRGSVFESSRVFSADEPSSAERPPVRREEDLAAYLEMLLCPEYDLELSDAARAREAVGGDYLLEFWLGLPFFDWVAEAIGFEKAVYWLVSTPEDEVELWRARHEARMTALAARVAESTAFESFVIGCSASCNSLLGPRLWRRWDKGGIAAVASALHDRGRFLHIHFHGRSRDALSDFVEAGVDCVCPFERPPGGDIEGPRGLREAREALEGRVTMNGNVGTVETLIRGSPGDVRREVREIKEAFRGSARCIIGTGDQVGRETPEENLAAMIEEAKSP
jgi:hypothetical protein